MAGQVSKASCGGIKTKSKFSVHRESGIKLTRTWLSRQPLLWKQELFQRQPGFHERQMLIQMTVFLTPFSILTVPRPPLPFQMSGQQKALLPSTWVSTGRGRQSCCEQQGWS
jgi:hypothetical protein